MKYQYFTRSLFVAFCAFFVCTSAVAETTAEAATVHLNPFAFKLSSSWSGDVFKLEYYLNAPADNVQLTIKDGSNVVLTLNCTDSLNNLGGKANGTTARDGKGIYQLDISMREYIDTKSNFRDKNSLSWSIDVNGGNKATYATGGAVLNAPKVTSYSYIFGRPTSVDIDVDPLSDNFGVIYMTDRNSSPDAPTGGTISDYWAYREGSYKPGMFLFDAAFQNMPVNKTDYDFENYNMTDAKNVDAISYTMNAHVYSLNGTKYPIYGAFDADGSELFNRVRIAYNSDHTTRVFLSTMPKTNNALILGEGYTNTQNNHDPIPFPNSYGGWNWYGVVLKANTKLGSSDVYGYEYNSKFVAGPNVAFDICGGDDDLKFLMCSGRRDGLPTNARESFRFDEFKLGKATSYNTTVANTYRERIMNKSTDNTESNYWYANDNILVDGCTNTTCQGGCSSSSGTQGCKGTKEVGFTVAYDMLGLEYDPDGGFWICQYRENHTEMPSLIHVKPDGTVNFVEYWADRYGTGVRYDNKNQRLLVAGGRHTTKKTKDVRTKNKWPNNQTYYNSNGGYPHNAATRGYVTIYDIKTDNLNTLMMINSSTKESSKDHRKQMFADSVYFSVGGKAVLDAAWDYADNVYIATGTGRDFCAYALPRKNTTASTPCKTDYYFDTQASELVITITPENVNCGEVVDLEFQKRFTYYKDDAKYKLEAKAANGYRFFSWLESKTPHDTKTSQYRTMPKDNKMRANFGMEIYETQSVVPVNTSITSGDYAEFTGVWVRRGLDDASYNTICLPFDITSLVGTPYEGATVLRLVGSDANNENGDNRVFLNFEQVTFNGDDYMHGGIPYLIQLPKDKTIAGDADLIFNNVRCPKFIEEPNNCGGLDVDVDNGVTFHGMLNPTTFSKDQVKDKLFLTADNRLVSLYGKDEFTINGLRGYFTVSGEAQNVEYMLNLPEKVVTSTPMVNMADSLQVTKYLWDGQIYIQKGNQVYDLSGARVK